MSVRLSGVFPTGRVLIAGIASVDPYFSNNSILLRGVGANNAQNNTIVDSSVSNLTITRNGVMTVGSITPFNTSFNDYNTSMGGSMYFPGTGSSYASIASTSAVAFGTGNFTIELWVYRLAATRTDMFDANNTVASQRILIYTASDGTLDYYNNSTSRITSGTTKLALNTWYHVALCRSSGSTRLFINGVQAGSTYTDGANFGNQPVFIGKDGSSISPTAIATAYMSNVRVVNGTALYTTTFTVPTSPLTAITNTTLLISATNAGIYDSTSRNVLVTVADAKISTSVYKYGNSSIYLDGTDDYLYTPVNTALGMGSGDFTLETWFYCTNITKSPAAAIMDMRAVGSGTQVKPTIEIVGSRVRYYVFGVSRIQSAVLSSNTWYHVAVVKNGSTTTLYINGVAAGTYADSNNYGTSNDLVIGTYSDNRTAWASAFPGYMQDFRITKGIARYTANFTPPSAL